MIKLSTFGLAVTALALAGSASADPVVRAATSIHKAPHSKHAKTRDVNGVGGAATGSLKARVTQPPGGK